MISLFINGMIALITMCFMVSIAFTYLSLKIINSINNGINKL